jgi:integrase
VARRARTTGGPSWATSCRASGHIRLARLSADDVDALLEDRAGSGRLARSSVGRLRTVLGKALDHAARRNLVRRNVSRLTNVPEGSSTTGRSLSPEEARKLLAAVKDGRLRAPVVAGVALGLRPGELLGLSWRDVDLDAGVVQLRQQMKRENNLPVLRELKTARSGRSLRSPPVVVEALRERRVLQDEERAAPGSSWSAERATQELVFTTANGRPVDASNLRRYFRSACKRAGIGRWTPTRCGSPRPRSCRRPACRWSTLRTCSATTGLGWRRWSTATSWRPPSTPAPLRCRPFSGGRTRRLAPPLGSPDTPRRANDDGGEG